MKTKPMQRVMSVIALLALALTTLVVPAFAAEPSATATLNVSKDAIVVAGKPHLYELTVRNTGTNPSGVNALLGGQNAPSIDAVVVTLPSYFATFQTSGVTPTGWETKILSNNRLLMRVDRSKPAAEQGSPIAPGGSFTFGVQTDVLPQEYDDGAKFAVAVSSNGGQNLEAASVAPLGTLDSAVKILDITNLFIEGPAGATDASVTDGQDNVRIKMTVQSHSSVDLAITPGLVKKTGTPDITVTKTEGDTVLLAGKSQTYTFTTKFAKTGQLTINGTAVGRRNGDERSNVNGAQDLDIVTTVQQATDFAFKSTDTTTVSKGAKTITLTFDKTGVPSGTATAAVELTSPTGAKKAGVVTSNPMNFAGGTNTQAVTFSANFVQGTDAEGLYSAKVTFTGTDDNGAAISITRNIVDLLNFDATLPVVTVELLLPDGSAVENMPAAAGNGRKLRMKGSVLDGGVKCGGCTLTYQLSQNGAPFGEAVALTNNSGDFDRTITVNGLAAGEQAGTLSVTIAAKDVAGNGPSTESANTIFDTRAATIEKTFPVTGGIGDAAPGGTVNTSRIDVIFDEGVGVPFNSLPAQWSVTGKRVDEVAIQTVVLEKELVVQRAERDTNGNRTVVTSKTFAPGTRIWFARLTLNSALAGNDTPTVTYDPDANAAGSSTLTKAQTRIFDRVSLDTIKGARQSFDNIAPALPVLTKVDGNVQLFDDAGTKTFWSMGGDALLEIGNVAKGTTVQVFQNGNKIAESDNTSDATTSILVEANLGDVEGPVTITLKALDSGVKTSGIGSHEIRIDNTAPKALGAVRDNSNTVTIKADDILLYGADADLDLVVVAEDTRGRKIVINVVNVAKPAGSEGDPTTLGFEAFKKLNQRVLTLDSSGYNLDNLIFKSVQYDAQFGPETVYEDRAGNKLSSPSTFTF